MHNRGDDMPKLISVLPLPKSRPNQAIIDALHRSLLQAKAGELHHVVVMAVFEDKTFQIRSHGNVGSLEEIGLLNHALAGAIQDASVEDIVEEPLPEGEED
jgi:hypothetical protein